MHDAVHPGDSTAQVETTSITQYSEFGLAGKRGLMVQATTSIAVRDHIASS